MKLLFFVHFSQSPQQTNCTCCWHLREAGRVTSPHLKYCIVDVCLKDKRSSLAQLHLILNYIPKHRLIKYQYYYLLLLIYFLRRVNYQLFEPLLSSMCSGEECEDPNADCEPFIISCWQFCALCLGFVLRKLKTVTTET